jgi:hypothetical protein
VRLQLSTQVQTGSRFRHWSTPRVAHHGRVRPVWGAVASEILCADPPFAPIRQTANLVQQAFAGPRTPCKDLDLLAIGQVVAQWATIRVRQRYRHDCGPLSQWPVHEDLPPGTEDRRILRAARRWPRSSSIAKRRHSSLPLLIRGPASICVVRIRFRPTPR